MNSKKDQPYRTLKATGLDALFGEVPSTTESISLQAIKLPPSQPRRYFDPQKMQQLVQSVKDHGILEPLLVRPLTGGVYELVAGERRLRAAREVGLVEVPVVVRNLGDEEALQLALIENLHREDLNPIEETEGILQLIAIRIQQTPTEVIKVLRRMKNELEGQVRHNVMPNIEHQVILDVFTGLGLMTWESFVKNRIPILNLPSDIMDALRCGKIAYTKARAIATVKDAEKRQALLEEAITQDLSLNQIKERLKAQSQPTEVPSLQTKMGEVYKRFQKVKVWSDPEKAQRLEALLAEMETLLGED